MLTVDNLTVSFGNNHVLKGLGINFKGGMVHGLVGLNGAGKTTLLNAICGYTGISSGSILLNGTPMKKSSVAYLESENYFYPLIKGREYLELFSPGNNHAAVIEWNRLFQLPLEQLIDGYSHGMKKKLALAGILLQDRPVVILDEPFNGLDINSTRMLSLVIGTMREQGKLVIVTSHILGSLTGICDLVHLLRHGIIEFSRGKEQYGTLEDDIFRETDSEHLELVRTIMKRTP